MTRWSPLYYVILCYIILNCVDNVVNDNEVKVNDNDNDDTMIHY